MKRWKRVGIVGRFKPLHKGGTVLLETICGMAEVAIIGIGSSNKYNLRNPFTAEETEQMIRRAVSSEYSNYQFIHIPDYAQIPEYSDGQKWRENIKKEFRELDAFITGNGHVAKLLHNDYQIINPVDLLSEATGPRIRSTEVRVKMAKQENWQDLVPAFVVDYLESNNLVERFRREFGQQTIAYAEGRALTGEENPGDEYGHTLEK